ncbi:MAG: hypothetical protein WAL66_01010, partial [Nitrososphaeraceae archaeon]
CNARSSTMAIFLQITLSIALRLLPFTVPQVDEFFKSLQTDLTYETARNFKVNDEDIRKPLLALILRM